MAKRKVFDDEPAVDGAVEPVAEEPTEVVPDSEKHIYVDLGGHGNFALVDVPAGYSPRDRRINYNGTNIEHVDDDPETGIWRYRAM